MMSQEPMLVELDGNKPQVADDAWVAPGAALIGAVRLESEASVWFNTVLRADGDTITIGPQSNVQDGCVFHTDEGHPLTLGRGVSVGHAVVLHGCTVEDEVIVGMGSTVLNGARVGRGSIVAAGAVVLEGTEIPPGSLVAGVPAKVRRSLTEDDLEAVRVNARDYLELRQRYAKQVGVGGR